MPFKDCFQFSTCLCPLETDSKTEEKRVHQSNLLACDYRKPCFFLRLQRHTQSYKEKYNNNQNEHVLGPSCLHCQRLASLPQNVYVALSTTCTNSSLDARQHGTSKSPKSFSVNRDQRLIYRTASRIVCWKHHAGNTMLFRAKNYVNQSVVVSGCTPR